MTFICLVLRAHIEDHHVHLKVLTKRKIIIVIAALILPWTMMLPYNFYCYCEENHLRDKNLCVCEGLSNTSELRRKDLSEYGQHIPLAAVHGCMEGIKHDHQHSALSSSWLHVNCIQLSQTPAMVTSLPG